ncbi:MAG: type II toxin-antitoxin system VapC family toxin [Jatrophihabitans sp.]|nr:MAG: type II toxin-antitoxin system VapC family toxin [Jatrophihabitans sp.]
MAAVLTCDTSVVVAGVSTWHPAHAVARSYLTRVAWLGAHVVAETAAVLSRLPHGHALALPDAVGVVRRLADGRIRQLRADRYVLTLTAVASSGSGGGAVYDAIVGATAREHEAVLVTLDRRAERTYLAVGARFEFIG